MSIVDLVRTGRGSVTSASPASYDEETFRYFLALEQKRSERSGRPFLLLLVDVQGHPAWSDASSSGAVGELFDALWHSLRETDFVGWYRSKHIVGAVLAQPGERAGGDVCGQVRKGVGEALNRLLPGLASSLDVRVYQFPFGLVEAEAGLWQYSEQL